MFWYDNVLKLHFFLIYFINLLSYRAVTWPLMVIFEISIFVFFYKALNGFRFIFVNFLLWDVLTFWLRLSLRKRWRYMHRPKMMCWNANKWFLKRMIELNDHILRHIHVRLRLYLFLVIFFSILVPSWIWYLVLKL